MADIFFIAIAFYIIYKVVFDFIVPVYKTTARVKNQFKNMHETMQQQPNNFQEQQNKGAEKQKKDTSTGEYIDFEEVKK
jgi:lipopolysaccharide export LptBFGC system permease protein LptF